MAQIFEKIGKQLWSTLGLGQRRCAHCLAPFFPEEESGEIFPSARFCVKCQKILAPYIGPRCRLCGIPAGSPDFPGAPYPVCERCARRPPPWHSLAYHGLYSGALRDLILRLKFDGELHLALALADFLLECSKCLPEPDYIIAIPQESAHLRSRGFNQSHELARALARSGKFELRQDLLTRIKHGRPQEELNAAQRRANLRGAFLASSGVSGKNLWLVDDVMTTGSTCAEAANELMAKGANKVSVLFAARTPIF